jgi:hypothetical protein
MKTLADAWDDPEPWCIVAKIDGHVVSRHARQAEARAVMKARYQPGSCEVELRPRKRKGAV